MPRGRPVSEHQYIVSGSLDGAVGFWSASGRQAEMTNESTTNRNGRVTSITFSNDDQYIASGYSDEIVSVFGEHKWQFESTLGL